MKILGNELLKVEEKEKIKNEKTRNKMISKLKEKYDLTCPRCLKKSFNSVTLLKAIGDYCYHLKCSCGYSCEIERKGIIFKSWKVYTDDSSGYPGEVIDLSE